MKDTHTSTKVLPVSIETDGTVAYVGWPRKKNEFGQLSIRFLDGEIRPCTDSECERFVNSLSHYYFVMSGDWAQAYGVAGTPNKKYQRHNHDGGGSLV